MNENLKKIREYWLGLGFKEEELNAYESSSVYLANMIMEYAHRGQKRENGEDYANHPSRVLMNYRHLIGIGSDGKGLVDVDLLYRHNIPFDGVQEVCLLHDVVEDTKFTIKDVRDIYVECGFKDYFDMYIRNALEYITHDKDADYEDYIEICLNNPISAMVKLMDMQDNLRVIDLVKYNKDRYLRAKRYLGYTYKLNKAYHFLENVERYRKELKEE